MSLPNAGSAPRWNQIPCTSGQWATPALAQTSGWRLCFKHILNDRSTQGQRYSSVTIICAGNDLLNGTHEAMQQWIADLREWAAHYEVVLRLVDIVGVSCL